MNDITTYDIDAIISSIDELDPANISVSQTIPSNTSLIEEETMNIFQYEHSGSKTRMHWIKDVQHKLLYCYIPKNSCSLFKMLFKAIIDRASPRMIYVDKITHIGIHKHIGHFEERDDKYKPSVPFVADKFLHNSSWKSFVILRDPLERLVSAFNEKCIKKDTPRFCEGLSSPTFNEFADQFAQKVISGKVVDINPHYRPQYTFCGLDRYFGEFDYVIYYDKATIAGDTLRWMEEAGINIDEYYYNWGEFNNETMFERKTNHAAKKSQLTLDAKVSFYSNYYDKSLAMKMINVFDIDYKTLKFTYPEWIELLP